MSIKINKIFNGIKGFFEKICTNNFSILILKWYIETKVNSQIVFLMFLKCHFA